MRRGRTATAMLAAAVLLLVGAPAAIGQGDQAAGQASAQGSLEALSQALDHAVAPSDLGWCGVTVTEPDEEQIDLACQDGDTAPVQASGSEPALEEVAAFETPRFWAGYYPLDDGTGRDVVLRAHVGGGVAVTTAEGDEVWYRPSVSFSEDWGLTPAMVPVIMLGTTPTDPLEWASERVVAVGDLTGDGADEVAVSHLVAEEPGEAVGAVTVLDGRTGETLWSQLYSGGITGMVVHDGVLVVAHETGERTRQTPLGLNLGEAGSVSELVALTFTDDGESVTAAQAWRLPGAPWTRWLDLEGVGTDAVAVASTDKPVGASGEGGGVVLIDAATGEERWQRTFDGYPRQLRHDETGDRLVVQDQTDPDSEYSYALRSFSLADGEAVDALVREDRLLLRLEAADVTGDGRSEWLTADAGIVDDGIVAGHVAATEPGATEPLWETSSRYDEGDMRLTYRLEVVDGPDGTPLVVAAAFETEPEWFESFDLRAHHGATGETAWVADEAAFALFLVPVDDGRAVLGATEENVVKVVRTDDGRLEKEWPLLADAFAAAAADVTGDERKELILGTYGGGVLAVVSDTLDEQPQYVWRTVVGDSVRELTVADVTGDGADEVVVAATTAVHVLRGDDGTVLYTIDHPDLGGDYGTDVDNFTYPVELVWTVAVGDLTGDGVDDIVVPTSDLAGYRGADGEELWRYEPAPADPGVLPTTYFSTTVIADGKAVAVYNVWITNPLSGAVAIDGASGEVAWEQASAGTAPNLWRNIALLRGQGLDGGDAVGFIHRDTLTRRFTSTVFPSVFPQRGSTTPIAIVHDLQTGLLLRRSSPYDLMFTSGAIHEGVLVRDGELHQVVWPSFQRFHADGADQIGWDSGGGGRAAAFADLGRAGERLLASENQGSRIVAYPAEVPWGNPEDHLEPLAAWSGLHTGELLVTDLDGDGIDEIVTYKRDDEARSQVYALRGGSYSSSSTRPFGVTILRASAEADG